MAMDSGRRKLNVDDAYGDGDEMVDDGAGRAQGVFEKRRVEKAMNRQMMMKGMIGGWDVVGWGWGQVGVVVVVGGKLRDMRRKRLE